MKSAGRRGKKLDWRHEIVKRPRAREDLKAIWCYSLAEWGEALADKYLAEIGAGSRGSRNTRNLARRAMTCGQATAPCGSTSTSSITRLPRRWSGLFGCSMCGWTRSRTCRALTMKMPVRNRASGSLDACPLGMQCKEPVSILRVESSAYLTPGQVVGAGYMASDIFPTSVLRSGAQSCKWGNGRRFQAFKKQ